MSPHHHRLPIAERSQVAHARSYVHQLCREAGLSDDDTHRAGLVVTELCTNLVKHTATGGELLVKGQRGLGSAAGSAAPWVEAIAIDRGPGIGDIAAAMRDGHSSVGSPGTGLGAIRRMSDHFDLHTTRTTGTIVYIKVSSERPPAAGNALGIGYVSVPVSGEDVCGDQCLVQQRGSRTMIAMADGLGHGPSANEAAATALAAAERASDSMSCEALLERMHEASRHTRGAAASIAEIVAGGQTVRFCGIGNVAGAILDQGTLRQAVSIPGTLGHQARTFRQYLYPWGPKAIFVMHTDGLSSHWKLESYPGLCERSPSVIAAALYRDFSRQRDDVTVLVARNPTA